MAHYQANESCFLCSDPLCAECASDVCMACKLEVDGRGRHSLVDGVCSSSEISCLPYQTNKCRLDDSALYRFYFGLFRAWSSWFL